MQRPALAVVPSAMVLACKATGIEVPECWLTCAGAFRSSLLALEMNTTEEYSVVQVHPKLHSFCPLLDGFPLQKCDDLMLGTVLGPKVAA